MLNELLRIERYIKQTVNSGEELPMNMYSPMKVMVSEKIIECITSKSRSTRSAAIRLSKSWSEIDEKHQRRVLNIMSRRV